MLKRLVIGLLVMTSLTLIGGDDKEKGYLGVTLDTQVHDHHGHHATGEHKDGEGVRISVVYDGGGAEKAGLENGDTIVSVNGIEVLGHKDLTTILDDFHRGDAIDITVNRAGELITKSVTLGEMPALHTLGQKWIQTLDVPRAYIGIEMETLNDQLASYFGVANGVLVTRVKEGDPAYSAGLAAGDVIVSLAGKAVAESSDLTRAMADMEPGDTFPLAIVRKGKDQTLQVTAGERKGGNFNFDFNFQGLEDLNQIMPNLEHFNSDEWRGQMEQLREELDQLKLELKKKDQ